MSAPTNVRFALGQPIPRFEDPRLLKGGGRYTDDLNLPGQFYSAFVRSAHAHARIRRIELAMALAVPGVVAVYTMSDLDEEGIGDLPTFALDLVPLKRPDGTPMFTPPHPPLARDKVAFVGDPVAFVVADTFAAARDAAEQVVVDYDVLDANANGPDALGGAPVWDDCADNICFRFEIGDKSAVDTALARAHHVAEVSVPITRLAVNAMEPRAALGEYDPFEERYTLRSGNQFPHDIRNWMAERVLHVSPSALRVVSPDMGGSFGLRSNVFPELVLVLFAAKRLGRPVKWQGDRSEALMEDHCRDIELKLSLGVADDGEFLGLRVKGIANMGAYLSIFGPLPAFGNLGGVAGTYTTPCIHAEITSVFTNTAPVHPYRGAGRPEATLGIESVIDEAARALNMDRVKIRRRNFIGPEKMPYQTPLTYCYDCGEFERNLDAALVLVGAESVAERRAAAEAEGKLYGFGIASAVEQAAGMFDEGAEVRFERDGTATLLMGVHSHGQGHATVFRQVLAEKLGLDPQNVRYVQGDTDRVSYGHGTGGSRGSGLGGAALDMAATRIINKGKRIAAHVLEAAEVDMEFDAGIFSVAGTDRNLTLADVARVAHTVRALPTGMDSGLSAFATFTPPGPTFPNACHVCEVLVDSETGVVELTRYCAVEDVGNVMNPMLLKGQLHGGIVQGVGQVLLEKVVFDDEAQLLSGSFMDYAMPRASDVPDFEIESRPVPTAKNPLGVKGVGEAGTVGALAAVMSAVNDALASAGVTHFEMPATPERVWRALREASSPR
jgi:carbon-monoxide dehydrogenase large subunit